MHITFAMNEYHIYIHMGGVLVYVYVCVCVCKILLEMAILSFQFSLLNKSVLISLW